jgi:formylmethanofuran dehydrogenase subunit E
VVDWGEFLCKVTRKPFYPVRKDGSIICSECGEVFVLDALQSSGSTIPMRCSITKREFYPYESAEGGRVVIRCSECRGVIYEPKAPA